MAGVAGGGPVAVSPDTVVDVIRLRLLVRRLRVAVDARKARVVRRNLMAIAAHRAVVRNREVSVVECRPQPTGGRVASVARLRIPGRDVVGHRSAQRLRAQPRRLVAPITSRVRRGQSVIVADVAIRASCNLRPRRRRHLMRAGQRPTGCAVVKRPGIPRHRVVTRRTKRSRESCGDVIRDDPPKGLCAQPG